MENLFKGCSSLKSLPDISKWNTSNVTKMDNIFADCKNLLKLPDISKWNTAKVNSMDYMFCNCCSLKYLPEISIWNINKVKNMKHMFENCKLLEYLPDLSKWNTSQLTNIFSIFYGMLSLKSLPDISKWKTSNLINMSFMIYDCLSLNENSIPDFSKIDLKNVKRKDLITFRNITSTISLKKPNLICKERTESLTKNEDILSNENSKIFSLILTNSKINSCLQIFWKSTLQIPDTYTAHDTRIRQVQMILLKKIKVGEYNFIEKINNKFCICFNSKNNKLKIYNTISDRFKEFNNEEYDFINDVLIYQNIKKGKIYNIIILTKKDIFYIEYNYEKNDLKYNTQNNISIKNCKFALKLINNFYIFMTNEKIYQLNNLNNMSNKIIEININNSYISGIQINKNYCVFTSNKIIKGGEDILDFYNVLCHKIDLEIRIKHFSFIKSTNGLALITSENKNLIIVLCACKKYCSRQKNGILLLVIKEIKDNLYLKKDNIKYFFYNTFNFEPHCFCQVNFLNQQTILGPKIVVKTNFF